MFNTCKSRCLLLFLILSFSALIWSFYQSNMVLDHFYDVDRILGVSNDLKGNIKEYGLVENVLDDGRIEITLERSSEIIKLIGIQLPNNSSWNSNQRCSAAKAIEYLRNLEGSTVFIKSDSNLPNRDKNDNLVRYVYYENGDLLNIELIEKGYAMVEIYSEKYELENDFREIEKKAEKNKIGIWGGKCR